MNDTLTRPPVRILLARDLPALPAAVLDLLDLFARDAIENHVLAAKIALDPALSAKTLRLANSSFYGLARHVSSLGDAVAVLGLRTMRSIVTTAALASGAPRPACDGFDLQTFWRHAIAVAVATKLVALEIGADPEAAFTAGLLHDMGRLAMASAHPKLYAQVLAHGDTHGDELARREHEMFGVDHAEAGALVAEHWRFPQVIVDAIGGHHPRRLAAGGAALTHQVGLGDQLVHALDHGAPLAPQCHQAWQDFGLAAQAMPRLLGEIELQARAITLALTH
jgi:putative nucleotidyltransferase with HDIG domain